MVVVPLVVVPRSTLPLPPVIPLDQPSPIENERRQELDWL